MPQQEIDSALEILRLERRKALQEALSIVGQYVHLPNLRDKYAWDTKVATRERWLDARRSSLGLSPHKPITSLIISDSPEVISHFSTTLCFSIREFPIWYFAVKEQQRIVEFDEFLKGVLQKRVAPWSDSSHAAMAE